MALIGSGSTAHAADALCAKLHQYAKEQWAEKGDTIPRHWVEFHWRFDPDPNTIWSWGCSHSEDDSSISFCRWLMKNTNQEFPSDLAIRVQRCMGYGFPAKAATEWHFTDGEVKHQARDGSWLVLVVSSQGMRSGESAVRITLDSVDRNLVPEELLPIQSLTPSASSDATQ